jgi:hypothetical protein
MSRVTPEWLTLREPADAAARATELVEPVRRHLAARPDAAIHDLGAGTGSMGRWLAPRLPGAYRWVLYDRDADLLARATIGASPVETRQRDITRLTPADLDGAGLITGSALLDMLTADELDRIVAACTGAGCPAWFTVSVVGRVELDPVDPLDAQVTAAFNDHQRRIAAGRHLLGPDAVDAAVAAFSRHRVPVRTAPSPWRLGADQAELAAEWFRGWLGAACEQRPELARPSVEYARRRLDQAATGRLGVVVHHTDLLAGS